jgi:hypothetical protein
MQHKRHSKKNARRTPMHTRTKKSRKTNSMSRTNARFVHEAGGPVSPLGFPSLL